MADTQSCASSSISEFVHTTITYCSEDSGRLNQQQYEDDKLYAKQSRLNIPVKPQVHSLKVLVVGAKYSGARALLRNIVYSNVQDKQALNNLSEGNWADFQNNPKMYVTNVTPQLQDHIHTYINVQRAPPLDSTDESQVAILEKVIRDKLNNYYEMDKDVLKSYDIGKDERVDVVLYVLAPEIVRKEEVEAMRRLTRSGVAVIPVVNKADSLQSYQQEDIANNLIRQMGEDLFSFSSASLSQAGCPNRRVFFAVSGNTVDDVVHDCWLVREYKWGRCEAFRSAYSDTKFLKQLVFEVGFHEIKDYAEAQYRNFCKNKINQESLKPRGATTPHPTTNPSPNPPHTYNVSTLTAPVPQPPQQVMPSPTVELEEEEQGSFQQDKSNSIELHTTKVVGEVEFDADNFQQVCVKKCERQQEGSFRLKLSYVNESRTTFALIAGNHEGVALSQFLENGSSGRPSVYDVWKNTLELGDLKVARVLIDNLEQVGGGFSSKLHIAKTDGRVYAVADGRPSDAINLGIRFQAPIFVSKEVVLAVESKKISNSPHPK